MCDYISWCNPVFKRVHELPYLEYATRNHAYITPDNKAYILNETGDGFIELVANGGDSVDLSEYAKKSDIKEYRGSGYNGYIDISEDGKVSIKDIFLYNNLGVYHKNKDLVRWQESSDDSYKMELDISKLIEYIDNKSQGSVTKPVEEKYYFTTSKTELANNQIGLQVFLTDIPITAHGYITITGGDIVGVPFYFDESVLKNQNTISTPFGNTIYIHNNQGNFEFQIEGEFSEGVYNLIIDAVRENPKNTPFNSINGQ